MVITAHVYAEHPDLGLAPTIRAVEGVELGVVSDAGTDPDHEASFIWAEAPDLDDVEAALEEDPTVAGFSPIVENGDRRTYRIEYSSRAKLLSPPLTEIGGLTQEARSHLHGWLLELRFQNHDGLYALDEYARAEGIQLDVVDIRHTEESHDSVDFGLTDSQREALVAAFVNGYYDEPRETSLEELAALLDISPTAVSGRLRRGSARLIEEVLLDGEKR